VEKSVTGESPVPGSRVSRDRFVRPGIMRLYYENGVRHPDNLEQLGGKQQEVVLQYLFIDEQAQGGEEKAKSLLKTLRQRIVDGEDMGDICEKFSAAHTAKKDHGLMPPSAEARFGELDPAIATFLTNAIPGDVSDPLFFKTSDGNAFLAHREAHRTQPGGDSSDHGARRAGQIAASGFRTNTTRSAKAPRSSNCSARPTCGPPS